jgi:hypothetical protein
MFSGPNSLLRLWLKLRRANFVTEKMLVARIAPQSGGSAGEDQRSLLARALVRMF